MYNNLSCVKNECKGLEWQKYGRGSAVVRLGLFGLKKPNAPFQISLKWDITNEDQETSYKFDGNPKKEAIPFAKSPSVRAAKAMPAQQRGLFQAECGPRATARP